MKNKFYSTTEWKYLRQQILERDDHKCFLCRCEDKLTVHHILYINAGYQDFKLEPLNLITLCPSCHYKIHKMCYNFKLLHTLRYERPLQYQFILDNV